jgi:hypothetical protein
MAGGKRPERPKLPATNDNNWLGNTVTRAKIQEIGADDRWHTLGECIDAPNAIKQELGKKEYQGHDVWIRDVFGDRKYHGTVK